MTTTKRCEVCGKDRCQVVDGEGLHVFSCSKYFCHGHSSPSPRPDDSEKVCGNHCKKCSDKGCSDCWYLAGRLCKCFAEKSPTPKEVPPRTEERNASIEWEDIFDDQWVKLKGVSKTLNQHRWHVKQLVRSLLLSYGKERERAMWLKCREAVDGWLNHRPSLYKNDNPKDTETVLDALDALNPDNSSPDEGREGKQ